MRKTKIEQEILQLETKIKNLTKQNKKHIENVCEDIEKKKELINNKIKKLKKNKLEISNKIETSSQLIVDYWKEEI